MLQIDAKDRLSVSRAFDETRKRPKQHSSLSSRNTNGMSAGITRSLGSLPDSWKRSGLGTVLMYNYEHDEAQRSACGNWVKEDLELCEGALEGL